MTVMTSLMILILMTFAAAILESTSLQTSKNIRRADVERSVESVFAEYQKEEEAEAAAEAAELEKAANE